ncbi:MAG: hypothetical protein ACK559_02725, partial [bacterium]
PPAHVLPGGDGLAFLGVERPAGDVVHPELRHARSGLLDQARALPGDAGVGVLPVDVGDEEVVTRRDLHFSGPGRLAGHGKHRADEHARVGVGLQRLNLDRRAASGTDREGHAVRLGGHVHIGVADEYLDRVAGGEAAHGDVTRAPHAP